MLRTLTAVLFLLLLPLHSSSAASLVTDSNGILTGARDILVGVNKYDVFIGDGTCVGLFSGCDEQSDFPFQSADSARAASQILYSLIIADGRFKYAQNISGCSGDLVCTLLLPFRLSDPFTAVFHSLPIDADIIPAGIPSYEEEIATDVDTGISEFYTYTVWTQQPTTTVPEPSTLMLLGIGWLSRRWLRPQGK
ncbi:MAG: hypothetical protein CTY19_18670 [Methylomonas sp.]|nr:MAG: hypothetical protein CTY19_18670 [Methylomonas sp.]